MTTPWRIDPRDLAPAARRFLAAVRRGLGIDEAAARAGVEPTEARVWLRDKRFAAAYQDARSRPGNRPRVISLNDAAQENTLISWCPSCRSEPIGNRQQQCSRCGWRRDTERPTP
jgi:hypothetical protein